MSVTVDFNGSSREVMLSYAHLGDGTTGLGRGVLTGSIAWVLDQDGRVTAAIARTSPRDNPVKSEGRRRAIERLQQFVLQSGNGVRVATAAKELTRDTNILQMSLDDFKSLLHSGLISQQYSRRKRRG